LTVYGAGLMAVPNVHSISSPESTVTLPVDGALQVLFANELTTDSQLTGPAAVHPQSAGQSRSSTRPV
jgi:hypothetical protein